MSLIIVNSRSGVNLILDWSDSALLATRDLVFTYWLHSPVHLGRAHRSRPALDGRRVCVPLYRHPICTRYTRRGA
jgi:hypothetical protein